MVASSPFDDRDGAGDLEGAGVGARGGPLLMPALETGLISVRDFQRSCVTLLSVVESELEESLALAAVDDDIKVDDLKIVTDAELVDKALTEVLQGRVTLGEGTEVEERDNCFQLVEFLDQPNSSGQNIVDAAGCEHYGQLEFGREHGSAGASEESDSGKDDSEGVDIHLPSSPVVTEVLEIGAVAASDTTIRPQEPGEQQQKGQARKRKRKDDKDETKRRGRPYDRAVRGAHLTTNGDDQREEALACLKLARDNAKENCGLNCFRVKRERDSMSNICAKLPSKFFTKAQKTQDEEIAGGHYVAVEPEEVVLHMEIYHGMRRHMKTQEFMVLGSQLLTALRDKIYCLTDNMAEKAGFHVPSGYFLIEDVFYDDLRDPSAIKYSVPFIQWIEEQKQASLKPRKRSEKTFNDQRYPIVRRRHRRRKSTLPTLSSASMADTCFLDLRIRIGAPYLYCHQGDCKHTIIFRDLRLVHPDDVQNSTIYPVLKFIPKLRYRKCTICDIYRAKKVTYGDSLAPSSPCFFCENCYHLLHYSDENMLLHDDFKVYDYSHE